MLRNKNLIYLGLIISVFCLFGLIFETNGACYCIYECNNGPSNTNSGGCGTPCGFGQPWTKYRIYYCVNYSCSYYAVGSVCSTADKCLYPGSDIGLKPGYCDCSYGSLYTKCCCSGQNSTYCQRYWQQDNNWPPEGVCPNNEYKWFPEGVSSCSGRCCTNECSSGQTQYSCSGNWVVVRYCGNYDSDPCLEWSGWYSITNCDNYDGYQYQCSGNWVQRRYVDGYCSGGSCQISYGSWSNYQYCGDDYYQYQCSGDWLQRRYVDNYCSGGSCGTSYGSWQNYQYCGNDYWEYSCSGDWVIRRYVDGYCSGSSCNVSYGSWQNYQDCNSLNYCSSGYYRDYTCSGGSCVLSNSYCTESCCDQYYGNSYAYCSGGTCYPPPNYTLTVSKSGSGSGTVTGPGINCGSDCSESFVAGTSVTLTATPASGSVFAGWSGDCSGTGSCSLTMTSNKSVTATFNIANQPPIASFSCNADQCPGGNSSTCTMYQPTSDINPCIFRLINNSTDPDGSISYTWWYIKKADQPDTFYTTITAGSGKIDAVIQKIHVVDPGIYTVKLRVQDNQGATAETTRNITVKREISAGFMCSTDNLNWRSCETLKISQGQVIYVKDDPSLPEHSVPSEGAEINLRIWQKGDGTNFETFAQNTTLASTTLTTDKKIIRLNVRDTASREDRVDHPISVTYPLPFWKEIPPTFFKWRDFLASLFSKIKLF